MRTDRQTDHDVGKGIFCNFVNTPKYDFKRLYHQTGSTPNTGSEENQKSTTPYNQYTQSWGWD
jgi:hypothetical protein